MRPVANLHTGWQTSRQRRQLLRCRHQVGGAQLQAIDRVTGAEQPLASRQGNIGLIAIGLCIHGKQADHVQTLAARERAQWRHRKARQGHVDAITRGNAEPARQSRTQHNAERLLLELSQRPCHHGGTYARHPGLTFNIDCSEIGAACCAAARENNLVRQIGRDRKHIRLRGKLACKLCPAGNTPFLRYHKPVRHQGENALAQLAGKAVHYGEHRNQASHTQHHAQHGCRGDNTGKAIASATEAVAQADENSVVKAQGSYLRVCRCQRSAE